MRARLLLLPVVLVVAVPGGASAATPPPVKRIGPGVTAGGVSIAGLTALQAARKLKAPATRRLRVRPIVLGVAGRPWTLSAERAELTVNATQTAKAALLRLVPGAVPLVISHDEQAVSSFVDAVARRVYRAPRNATLRMTLDRMYVRRSRQGRGLDVAATRRLVNAALTDQAADRRLHMRLTKLRPATNANDVRRQYGTVVTIDKRSFRLRLFKQLRFVKGYGIATGLPAYPTPSGRFSITSKQINPTWSVPNSPWAGELQGTSVAGGSAANPLKARWMGIVDGIGIHGTGEEGSIGTRASHGCLRMRVADVKALYRRVPLGTAVLIG